MFAKAKFWRVILLGSALGVFGNVRGAEPVGPRYTGMLPIREWTPEETGGDPQSFAVTQHPATGLIYVGNELGILEYDGARWRRLPAPAGAAANAVVVRGLTFDDLGRLWGGSDNDVLVYSMDDRGRWRVETLRARLSAGGNELGVVWELCSHGGFIWGTTTRGIIRIDPRTFELRQWPLGDSPAYMGEVDGELWFRHERSKLLRTHGDLIGPGSVPEIPGTPWVLGVGRSADGVLQAEHAGGVLELRDGAWVELSDELARTLNGRASRVCRLPGGGRVFSTRARTLVFADAAGQVLGQVNEPPNITFGVTPRTYRDRDGGLWMANASGIRRAQIDNRVVRHDRAQGLHGGGRRLGQEGAELLVGTAQGLFVRNPATGLFTAQAGTPSDTQAMVPSPIGGWIIAAGERFGEWRAGAAVHAPGQPTAGLSLALDPRDEGRVFVGRVNAFEVYRRHAGGWIHEATVPGLAGSLYGISADGAGTVWAVTGASHGLWRASAPEGDWRKATVERVDEPAREGGSGLPAAVWRLATVEEGTVIFGPAGTWTETAKGRFELDGRYAGLPRGAATPLLEVVAGANAGTVYVAGDGDFLHRYWRGTRSRRGEPWQFAEILVPEAKGQVNLLTMRESPDGRTLWLGGHGGVFSVALDAAPAGFAAPAARWRGVAALEGGEVYFGGAGVGPEVALPRDKRAVKLEFAAASLRVHLGGRTGVEYRTRAAGVDRDWTAWSEVAARELTNLPPGGVKLEVQARNHLGAEGPVAVLTLAVPSFWWERWWARALAVLAGAGLVAVVVRWTVRRQFRQRIALLEAQAAVQRERLRIARDMHDDLGSTLASIVHLSDRKTGKGDAPDAVLARIHEATRDLVHRTRDIVWAATPQHDSLESLVEQMAGHAERTLGDRGVTVKLELPAQVPEEAVGSAARHDLFLAFKEAVNNAAKYAQARTATLRVEVTISELIVTLADDGVGFAPGELKGTGNGLGNLRQRLAALGGSAEIASTVGRGTTVTLRLPRGAGGSRS